MSSSPQTSDAGQRLHGRALIVDPVDRRRAELAEMLSMMGLEAKTARSAATALSVLAEGLPDLLLVALDPVDAVDEGDWRRLRASLPASPVLVISGDETRAQALQICRNCEADLVPAPVDREFLQLALRNAMARSALARQVGELRSRLDAQERFRELVGADGGLRDLSTALAKVLPTELTVLLQGEAGTGKDLLARLIHQQSPRAGGPFVVLRCGSVPATLLESELFGNEAGAAPGLERAREGLLETATGGTLYIDEVATLPLEVQARLVDALNRREIQRLGGRKSYPLDLRLVCGTREDLSALCQSGGFREDLFYGIAVFPLQIPPLRQRREDIPALVTYFLERADAPKSLRLHRGALEILEAYAWPGNVRELQNVLRRTLVLAGEQLILPEHLPAHVQAALADTLAPLPNASFLRTETPGASGGSTLPPLEDVERHHILRAIEACRGNLSQASRMLGIGRTTLYRKLQRYGITA